MLQSVLKMLKIHIHKCRALPVSQSMPCFGKIAKTPNEPRAGAARGPFAGANPTHGTRLVAGKSPANGPRAAAARGPLGIFTIFLYHGIDYDTGRVRHILKFRFNSMNVKFKLRHMHRK